jgi:hypothetical protein
MKRDLSVSKREELITISQSITKIEETISQLHEASYPLEEKKQEIIAALILEEKLLNGSKWRIEESNYSGSIVLEYNGNRDDDLMLSIDHLINGSFHSTFVLEPEIELQYDDMKVRLCFTNPNSIYNFIVRHGIVVDGKAVTKQLHHLKREVISLETICHRLNLKG